MLWGIRHEVGVDLIVASCSQGITPGKRGPRPVVPDAELLDLIRHDLTTSPFRGDGDRKVWGVHRHRALERRVRKMARLQPRGPVCGPGAHQSGFDEIVRVRDRQCGPWVAVADGSRQPVPLRTLRQSG
jgi:hypothetical protein